MARLRGPAQDPPITRSILFLLVDRSSIFSSHSWRLFASQVPADLGEGKNRRNQGKLQVFVCSSKHQESQREAYLTSRDRDMWVGFLSPPGFPSWLWHPSFRWRRSRSRAGTVCDRVDWHTKCQRVDEALISSSAVMVQADTTRMRIPPWIWLQRFRQSAVSDPCADSSAVALLIVLFASVSRKARFHSSDIWLPMNLWYSEANPHLLQSTMLNGRCSHGLCWVEDLGIVSENMVEIEGRYQLDCFDICVLIIS